MTIKEKFAQAVVIARAVTQTYKELAPDYVLKDFREQVVEHGEEAVMGELIKRIDETMSTLSKVSSLIMVLSNDMEERAKK